MTPVSSRPARERILELTYELEGLLDESLGRDEVPALMLRLIADKISAIHSLAFPSAVAEPAPAETPSPAATPSAADTPAQAPAPKETPGNTPEETPENASDPSDGPVLPPTEDYSIEDDEDEDFEDLDEEIEEALEEILKKASENDADNQDVARPDEEMPEDVEETPAPEEEPRRPRQENPRPRSASRTPIFSLNDRFLYSRELFGGSVQKFERALTQVASMESYEEAEEYFYTEHGFDPENPVVADFLLIISSYF